jgi:hypothetical protein
MPLLQLLKHVTSSELQEEEAVQQQELDALRALDMVQGSFDVLRAIFGDKGPCVKPKGEVSHHHNWADGQRQCCSLGKYPKGASVCVCVCATTTCVSNYSLL